MMGFTLWMFTVIGSISYITFEAVERGFSISPKAYLGTVFFATVIPYAIRQIVGKRARWTCESDGCDRQWWHGWMLEFHHTKPRNEGGTDDPDNIEFLCIDHHRDRHKDLSSVHKRRGNKKLSKQNAYAARAIDKRDRRQKNWKEKWKHKLD